MRHPGDKPYSASVKVPTVHLSLPETYSGLPETLSLGNNLSKDEAIFDLIFSFRVKIKRYMKYQLGILCLVLVLPIPAISLGCLASG